MWKISIIQVDTIIDFSKTLAVHYYDGESTSNAKSHAIYLALQDPRCGKEIESYRGFCVAPEWKRICRFKHECVYDVLNHYVAYRAISTKSYVIRIERQGVNDGKSCEVSNQVSERSA